MPDDGELRFVQQLKRLSDNELINFYFGLVATYSVPPPESRHHVIELTRRELKRRSNKPKD